MGLQTIAAGTSQGQTSCHRRERTMAISSTDRSIQHINSDSANTTAPTDSSCLYFFLIFIYLFGCTGSSLQQVGSLVAARQLFSCGMQTLSCGMHVGSSSLTRDQTPALGGWSPIHCTTREVPPAVFSHLLWYVV